MFNKPTRCFLVGTGLLLALSDQVTQAGTQGDIGHPYQRLLTLTLGPDFVHKGQAQTLSLYPPFQNHYTNTHSSTTVADAGAFVGIERIVSDKLWIQLGISGYVDEQISPEGHLWRFGLPEFDTLAFSYNVRHARVMAEGKFLTTCYYQALNPYVSWGLGAAFNQAHNYQETPLIPGAIPTLPFGSHTQTSLAWGIGVGIDYTINPRVRFGAGYQFTDLGSVSLGATPAATTTTQTLSFPHLYTNQLRFQLTFLV